MKKKDDVSHCVVTKKSKDGTPKNIGDHMESHKHLTNETNNKKFQKIFLTKEDESQIFIIIKTQEIFQAIWEDCSLTLCITYNGNIERTISFGDRNEAEYKRVKALFV